MISSSLPEAPDAFSSEALIELSSELRPGVRLGRYELLVPIARGGMARVWVARQHGQLGFQKIVAVKTILPHLAGELDFERMFLDEARIASGVHHPNVCEIYDLGEERHALYLAMEWVSGDSLARLLRASGTAEPLDPRVAARILADACAGAHAAHELTDDEGRVLGVVHRDLSPHNILLTCDGIAKVCDFGVAKALGQLHDPTSVGQLKGKIGYMSPEQVQGAPLDRRSDVFALGCVLYEVTTGVRPFRGERELVVMQAIAGGTFEPPTGLRRGYPPELERVVLRALAREPVHRYSTAEHMRIALEEFLRRGPIVTHSTVAQVVRSRLGEHLARRSERIRRASPAPAIAHAVTGAAHAGASPDVHDRRCADPESAPAGVHAAFTTGPHLHPSSPSLAPTASGNGVGARQYALAVSSGVLLAVAICLAGTLVWRARVDARAVSAPAATTWGAPAVDDEVSPDATPATSEVISMELDDLELPSDARAPTTPSPASPSTGASAKPASPSRTRAPTADLSSARAEAQARRVPGIYTTR